MASRNLISMIEFSAPMKVLSGLGGLTAICETWWDT